MLTIDRLCFRMICLLYAPIRVCGFDGTLLTVYVDLGEQQDVFNCDPNLLTQLQERTTAAYPVFYLDSDETIYSIVTAGQGIFIIGPCCLGLDPAAVSRQFVQLHGMDKKKPFRISAYGLLPEIAYSMSDAFIQRLEELRNPGEALALARQAEVNIAILSIGCP